MEQESDSDTNYTWCFQNSPQKFCKVVGRVVNRRMNKDHYGITKIGQNTEMGPGDLRRSAVHSDPSERPSANADVKN